MNQAFEKKYRDELTALRTLFGCVRVQQVLPRLKEIHEYTESKWQEYAAKLGDGGVRFLLIAEAPPWSSEGKPQYLLDPSSRARTLMGALRQTFSDAHVGSSGDSLSILAARGFLLLDSIPFSMDYSSKRSRARYDDLLRLTVTSYLQAKIDSSGLSWSGDVRVAFAVKRNALSILKSVAHLSIGDRRYYLSQQMIAVNGAGYPDSRKLREIYRLQEHGDVRKQVTLSQDRREVSRARVTFDTIE